MTTAALPKVIAHRGGRSWAPENTLAAFKLSLARRLDGIELDVQRCATGELVVIHDSDVSRTTNGVGLVKDITFDELKRLSAGLWFDKAFAGERIPSLQEVLDLVDGQLTINIEIKNAPYEFSGIEEDLMELLDQYGHNDRIIVSSFDHPLLGRLHSLKEDLNLALLADGIFADVAGYANSLGATYWHPCFDSIRADVVSAAHKAGIKVNAWTINNKRDWAEAIKMELDGIVTDDPEELATFLARVKTLNAPAS